MSHYTIKVSRAKMPSSVKCSDYYRIGLLEIDSPDVQPKMISDRARGVVRVVAVWDRVYMGSTARCAYAVAMREAEAMRDQLAGGVTQ